MAVIISASRRTDIPRYYARWFENRRRAGYVTFRNAFGVAGQVSLRDEHVLGYLFWTRYAAPMRAPLQQLLAAGTPFAFQYTLTAYGADLEPNRVDSQKAVDDFVSLSALLPHRACIQWRYDPIVLSERYSVQFHTHHFTQLCRALAGSCKVVNTSIVEPYLRTVSRMERVGRYTYGPVDQSSHRSVAKRWPELSQASTEELLALTASLGAIAAQHGVELRACANPHLELPTAQCCGAELFAPFGDRVAARLRALKPRPTRSACRCIAAIDIGTATTCPAGCLYCYATASTQTAQRKYRNHDPSIESLG